MNPAWAYFILTIFVLVCSAALAWAGAIRRKRHHEEFLIRKTELDVAQAELRAKSCN